MSAPLVSDTTIGRCVRAVWACESGGRTYVGDVERAEILRALELEHVAHALDVARCYDDGTERTPVQVRSLIAALEDANEEAARTQEGRDIIEDVNSMLASVYTGLKPEEIFVLPSAPEVLRERHAAEAKALEEAINKRLPEGVRVHVAPASADLQLKLAISERDEARAERDGLRAELAATKKKLQGALYRGRRS